MVLGLIYTYFDTFFFHLFKTLPTVNEKALTPPKNVETCLYPPIKYQEWYTHTTKIGENGNHLSSMKLKI